MNCKTRENRQNLRKKLGLVRDLKIQSQFSGHSLYYSKHANKKLSIQGFKLDQKTAERKTDLPILESLAQNPSQSSRGKIDNPRKELCDSIGYQDMKFLKLLELGLKHNKQNFKRSEYKRILHRNFRENMKIGFLQEKIYMDEIQFMEEAKKMNDIRKGLTTYRDNFDRFVNKDHKSTMSWMAQATKEMKIKKEKANTLEEILTNLGSIQYEMNALQDAYEKCRTCELFLFNISPDSWKKASSQLPLHQESESGFEEKSELYFKDTSELHLVFNELDDTCYKMFENSQYLKYISEDMRGAINQSEEFYMILVENLEDIRQKLESSIEIEERTCDAARYYAEDLIQGVFHDVTAGHEYLILLIHLQQHYMVCFDDSESVFSISQMFKALETEHKNLQFEEDNLPTAEYHQAVVESNAKQKARIELSERMRRELNEFDNLTQRTLKLLNSPQRSKSRKLMQRSDLIQKAIKPKPPIPPLTEKEKFFLYLFTDRCDYDSVTRQNFDVDQATINKYFPD